MSLGILLSASRTASSLWNKFCRSCILSCYIIGLILQAIDRETIELVLFVWLRCHGNKNEHARLYIVIILYNMQHWTSSITR